MSYDKSPFNISPAVEVAYDLHPLAALYRAASCNEPDSALQRRAREFRARLYTDTQPESWRDRLTLLSVFGDRSLAAPRNKAQLKRSRRTGDDPDWNIRHLTITPLLASCTNFVRNNDNLWDFPKRMALSVRRGCVSKEEYVSLMEMVAAPAGRDIFQLFIDAKLKAFDLPALAGGPRDVEPTLLGENAGLAKMLYPYSEVLVKNLRLMCDVWRPNLVSTQFVVLLDSALRLHAFSEVRHLAMANMAVFDALLKSHASAKPLSPDEVRTLLAARPLQVGADLMGEVRTLAVGHERSRQGWGILQESGCDIASRTASIESLAEWSVEIAAQADAAFVDGLTRYRQQSNDGELDSCINKSSSLNNFTEFMKYTLQQRAMDTGRDGQYDQGYWACKQGTHKAAPYKISISPFGALAYAGLAAKKMPTCTFADIKESLELSGLALGVSGQDQLYRTLKGLGVTIDSPDGAGGFLVSNPFYVSQ